MIQRFTKDNFLNEKYWVLHIILSLIKLLPKIELLNQFVQNPQSNIHGYILRFHYIHYQYNTAFTKSFMFGLHVWISGVCWINRGGSRSNTAIITCALRCKRHSLRKAEEPLKIISKFNTCSRNTIPHVKISLNKNLLILPNVNIHSLPVT